MTIRDVILGVFWSAWEPSKSSKSEGGLFKLTLGALPESVFFRIVSRTHAFFLVVCICFALLDLHVGVVWHDVLKTT